MNPISSVSSATALAGLLPVATKSTKPAGQTQPSAQDQVSISESARQAAADNTGAKTGVDVDHDGDHS